MTLPCPVCGTPVQVRAPADRKRPFGASGLGSTRLRVEPADLATCRSCGLGWQVSPPSAEELQRGYASLTDEAYLAEADNRLRSFEGSASLLDRYTKTEAGKLLDVGCSAGLFLDVATRRGWDAWGVEPSRWMADKARGRVGDRVIAAMFEDAALEEHGFDAVTMWDVLEHVSRPDAFLATARRAMKPGAILLVNVPARDTWIATLLGRHWPLLLPEHLFYFSRASLRILLGRAGFDVLGYHRHVVFFSLDYVQTRLEQHGLPTAKFASRAFGHARLPLLMGEVTVVARAS